jgi:hypothetical protein
MGKVQLGGNLPAADKFPYSACQAEIPLNIQDFCLFDPTLRGITNPDHFKSIVFERAPLFGLLVLFDQSRLKSRL